MKTPPAAGDCSEATADAASKVDQNWPGASVGIVAVVVMTGAELVVQPPDTGNNLLPPGAAFGADTCGV